MILNEILSKGFDGQNIITGLTSHFRDLLVCKDEATLVLFEVGASIREKYKQMAQRCPDHFLFKAIEHANQCDLNFRVSRNKRLLLELTLIQLCQLLAVNQTEDKKKNNIEPLNMAETATAGSVTAHVPPKVQAVPTVKPEPVSRTASIPKEMPSEASKRNARPPHIGTSLRDLGSEKPKDEAVVTKIATVNNQSANFAEQELLQAWVDYADSLEKKVYLKNTMLNCKPSLKNGFILEVAVHNPVQEDELNNNATDILIALRQQLRNYKIQMSIRIDESNQKQLAYTSAEKYEHLLNINPALGKLRDEFNLILD